MVRRIAGFAVALAVMVVLGSIAHSLFVQEAWTQSAGSAAAIPTDERLSWVLHDLVGLQPLYGVLVGVALLVAFLAAGLVARYTGLRTIVFAAAGAIAILVMFTLLKSQLGTVGVFGARGTMGMGAQMVAGLIAGLVFALISKPRVA